MIGNSPSAKATVPPKMVNEDNQRLGQLRKALLLNRTTQERLKVTRQLVRERMDGLEEYISTFRTNSEFPPCTAILSYIKFQRNLSITYKEQARVAEPVSQAKPKQEEDAEFMIKLHQRKVPKKKQPLNLEELPDDPNLINFTQICKGTQFRYGIDVFRNWLDTRRGKPAKVLFNMQEDKQINALYQMYGQNWDKIAQIIGTRSLDEIYYEYHNRINPRLTIGRWTIRQTLTLIILLEHFGARRWALIAKKMVVKSQLQARERYCNLVDPTIGKDLWTHEMERRLLEVAEEHDFCWKQISLLPVFKGKTDNCVWRKYKCLMGRFTEEEIREQLPNQKKYRGLADKIIKEKRTCQARKRSAKNKAKAPVYYSKFRPKEPSKTPPPPPPPPNALQEDEDEAYFNEQSEDPSLHL